MLINLSCLYFRIYIVYRDVTLASFCEAERDLLRERGLLFFFFFAKLGKAGGISHLAFT